MKAQPPFAYRPEWDSDGEVAGVDHFVIDANEEEIACAPSEEIGLLWAAAPDLLEAAYRARDILAEAEWGGTSHPGMVMIDAAEARKRLETLCAAIARAEGKR